MILRPMLDIGGGEIRQALAEAGIPWREDGSNETDAYLRNRIRHRILPEMEQMAPGAGARIARAAALIRAEHEALGCPGEAADADWMRIDALRDLPAAIRGERLRAWWRARGPALMERNLSAEQTAALAGLMEAAPGTRINLPGGWHAERGRKHLHLMPPAGEREPLPPVPWREGGAAFGEYRLESVPVTEEEADPGDGKETQVIPAGWAEGCEIRIRRDGDRIRPFGMDGSRKLQDYLTDRKIDRAWRDRIPLLCRGNEVLWAAGVGTGAVPPRRAGEKHLRLQWIGPMPWNEGEKENT